MSTTGVMGATSTGGYTPIALILLDNVLFDGRAVEATIQRSVGQHDSASLTLMSTTLTSTAGILDSPISFVYGLGARTEIFYGYVTNVTEVENPAQLTFTIEVLAPTAYMSGGKPRFWANKSIPHAIQDLVHISWLGFYTTGHPQLWKSLAQTEDTDWQRAVKLALRIGFTLIHWNGIVLCVDPLDWYATHGPFVQLISESNVDSDERQILEFTPGDTSEQTYTGMGIIFSYLGSDLSVQVVKPPGFTAYRFSTANVVRNQAEADAYQKGLERVTERWRATATARIKGDPTIYPGVSVDIQTVNSALVTLNNNGKWMVVGIQHKLDNQDFQTVLTLTRPNEMPVGQVFPFRHFWEGDSRGKPTMWLKEHSTGVKRWMSSWTDSRVGAVL